MKRFLLVIFGLILSVIGLGCAAGGGVLIALFGTTGSMATDLGVVRGTGYALVMNEFAIKTPGDQQTANKIAKFTVTADSVDGKPMFIGIGPSADVNKYFESVPRDVVSDLSNGNSRVVPIPGTKTPDAPGTQSFWVTKAQGTSPTVELQQDSTNMTLVIMQVTPVQPISAGIDLGVQSDSIFPISIGLIVVGAIVLIIGIWMLVRGFKPKRRQPPPAYQPGMGAGGVPLGQSSLADLGQQPLPPVNLPPNPQHPQPPAQPVQNPPQPGATHWPPPNPGTQVPGQPPQQG